VNLEGTRLERPARQQPEALLCFDRVQLVFGSQSEEEVGSIGLNLEAAPGVTLNAVTYTVTGNGFSKTGTIDTSGAPTVSGTIGGIPAGKKYTISLQASSVESGSSFTGSAQFDVTAGGTTAVKIHLKGAGARGNGNVSVTGTINVGPVIDEFTVTPLQVFVGKKVSLKAVGSDPDNGPSALSYYWSTISFCQRSSTRLGQCASPPARRWPVCRSLSYHPARVRRWSEASSRWSRALPSALRARKPTSSGAPSSLPGATFHGPKPHCKPPCGWSRAWRKRT